MRNVAEIVDAPALNHTLAHLRSLFKKIGITRVANVTGLDTFGLPVAVCIRPNGKHLSVSQGKGLTWEQAQVSAIMESIESYHIENPQPPSLFGSYSALINYLPVIHPKLFATGNFLFDHLELGWINGTDLITQQTVYLPHVLTFIDSTIPQPHYAFFTVSSNGLAAGTTLEQAICHGIHEIIERDCATKFLQLSPDKQQQRQLDLTTIDSPIIHALLKQLTIANIEIAIWDITSTLGVPAFRCILYDDNIIRGLHAFMGNSANSSKEKALLGALTEALQSRLTFITGSRDDTFSNHYAQQKKAFAIPRKKIMGNYSYQHSPASIVHTTFNAQLADLKQRLSNQSYPSILVVNHTKTDIAIPVVHVFIPGMLFNENAI